MLANGEARVVDYRFDRRLESERYLFLRAEGLFGQRLAAPPAIGERWALGSLSG